MDWDCRGEPAGALCDGANCQRVMLVMRSLFDAMMADAARSVKHAFLSQREEMARQRGAVRRVFRQADFSAIRHGHDCKSQADEETRFGSRVVRASLHRPKAGWRKKNTEALSDQPRRGLLSERNCRPVQSRTKRYSSRLIGKKLWDDALRAVGTASSVPGTPNHMHEITSTINSSMNGWGSPGLRAVGSGSSCLVQYARFVERSTKSCFKLVRFSGDNRGYWCGPVSPKGRCSYTAVTRMSPTHAQASDSPPGPSCPEVRSPAPKEDGHLAPSG